MKKHVVLFKMEVEVYDAEMLWDVAIKRAMADGDTRKGAIEILGTRADPDVAACIQMLADPGESWMGTTIEQSYSNVMKVIDNDDVEETE